MKKSIKIILCVFGMILMVTSFSQSCCPYISTPLKIIPDNPTVYDNIQIVTTVTLSTKGDKLQSSFIIQNDSIKIKGCYSSSGLSSAPTILDTLNIGKLKMGKYTTYFFASINDSSNSCTYKNGQSRTDSFKVTLTNGINYLPESSLNLSPNPVSTTLHLTTTEKNYQTEIYDLTGRTYSCIISKDQIDVSNLPIGIYLLRLKNEKGSIVKKFMKE